MHLSSTGLLAVPVTQKEVDSEKLKVVSFAIAGYRLGLPMEAVLRVVNCPLELQNRSGMVELIHLGSHAITVLNLHSHLALKQVSQRSDAQQFLVVTPSSPGEFCAIRVDTPPDLVELPLAMIRKLPQPYRNGHPLNIASRVAVLPQGKATLAVFLLDMNRVLEVVASERSVKG
jgi:chemotaxis signal transduction protein